MRSNAEASFNYALEVYSIMIFPPPRALHTRGLKEYVRSYLHSALHFLANFIRHNVLSSTSALTATSIGPAPFALCATV